MSEVGRYLGNAGYGTPPPHPWDGIGGFDSSANVGSYLPNAWELYDMHGNVREFCLDWFSGYPGAGAVTDPTGPSSSATDLRSARGGSFGRHPNQCRSATRDGLSPGATGEQNMGFRAAIQPQ